MLGHTLFRLSAAVLLALYYIYGLTPTGAWNQIHNLGWMSLLIFLAYGLHFFCIIFKGYFNGTLHRVYSKQSSHSDFPMDYTSEAKPHKYDPVQSISEFSAIQGGIANKMLISVSSGILVIVIIAFKMERNRFGFNRVSTQFTLLGAFGIFFIGAAELMPGHNQMKIIHYLGVLLSIGAFIGFNIQHFTQKIAIIDVISIVAFILWCRSCNRSEMMTQKIANAFWWNRRYPDANTVSSLSFWNILFEGVYFCGTGLCLSGALIYH